MADWYTRCLRYPGILLAASLLLATAFIYQIRYFDFDASADTLVVQGDPELARYLDMAEQFVPSLCEEFFVRHIHLHYTSGEGVGNLLQKITTGFQPFNLTQAPWSAN